MTVRLFCFNKNVVVSFVLNIYNNMSLHVIVFTGLKNGEVKHSVTSDLNPTMAKNALHILVT